MEASNTTLKENKVKCSPETFTSFILQYADINQASIIQHVKRHVQKSFIYSIKFFPLLNNGWFEI